MKTIEERAEEYAGENWLSDGACFACEDGYIKGATEQQAIDIDKALDAFCMTECQRKGGMPCAHLSDGGCTNYRKFIKAMKGE